MEKEKYVSWVQDYKNGLRVQKIAGDYVFDLQYTPTDYVWLQRNKQLDLESNEGSAKEELKNFQYYILTVSAVEAGKDFINYKIDSQEDKQKKVYYFSYLFQEDIKLEENGELLACVLYHFERSADANGSRKIVLGFENLLKDTKEAKLIITSDQFGSLPIRLRVSKENIPILKI